MEAITEIQRAKPTVAENMATRKKRVLLVITSLGTGGATNVVLHIARHLHHHPSFDTEILTGPIPSGREDLTPLAHEEGIPTRVVPNLINKLNPLVNLKAIADLRRIMVQENYDVVHSHSSVAGVVARLAAVSARVPAVVHHVHGWALNDEMSRGMRMLYLLLERLGARLSDRLIMVSKSDIIKGLDHRIGGERKFSLIYNGIELEQFRPAGDQRKVLAELGLHPNRKVVGMIGRLDKQKNPLDFIKAAAMVVESYKDVQFLIVGDGPLRPESEQLIQKLGLQDRFFLLGFRDDVPSILSTMTIVAMSSLWEGLPIVFLEAISVGKPIVANNVDGAKEVVVDGETGFLVTPHRPSEMADRILYLLQNEAECEEMGIIAQHRSNYFSVQRMVEQVESVYRELLATSPRSK